MTPASNSQDEMAAEEYALNTPTIRMDGACPMYIAFLAGCKHKEEQMTSMIMVREDRIKELEQQLDDAVNLNMKRKGEILAAKGLIKLMPETLATLKYYGTSVSLVADIEKALSEIEKHRKGEG